jgi:hypothetical protein
MVRFDFKRRRRGNDGPIVLGLVVPQTAINSKELLLLDRLHMTIMAETKGLSIIFEDEIEESQWMPEPQTAKGEDRTFGNQKQFKEAIGLRDRYPSKEEAEAWLNEIVARAYAIWWPEIEAAKAEGPDR